MEVHAIIRWLTIEQYKNDTHEIDIELRSYQDTSSSPTSPVNFVLHADGPGAFATPRLPFHPSDGFHEYRFDWSPRKVSFYADGQFIQDLTQGIPVDPGFIMLNHWSNGNGWSKGPPTKDVTMTVAYVKAYFNKGPEAAQTPGQCDDTTAKGAVCEVPDHKGPVTPDQETVFLTKGENNILPTPEPKDEPRIGTTDFTMTKKVSPDATCGNASGYTCLGSEKGNCCSSHGWWWVRYVSSLRCVLISPSGTTSAYCGEGCQSSFGHCDAGPTYRMARRHAVRK